MKRTGTASFNSSIYMRIRIYVEHAYETTRYETTRKGCDWFEGYFFHHLGETSVVVTSILSSDLESELRDGAEYSPELDQLMRKARKASNFLKALSHENRLLLLCLLAERERSVTELENILSLRQSAVSQQLARLRYDGMVDTRRDGKTIYYSLANEDVRRVISVVYDIFCAPVTATDKK